MDPFRPAFCRTFVPGWPTAAETYLLVTRMLGWDLDTYQEWLATTGIRLCAPGGAPRPG